MGYRIPIALSGLLLMTASIATTEDDPYLWLEQVESPKALAWAEERSGKDIAVIEAVPEFRAIYEQLQEIYNSADRIPVPTIRGQWIYNFWQDQSQVRGLWRRTVLDEYVREAPVWETVLDIDVLADDQHEDWVWKGATCLWPDYSRCLVGLSRGGADAAVYREFDTKTKKFVREGFSLPEAKSWLSWMNDDTLWVGTDFGEGSLTTSGYPRIVKLWSRGAPLAEAATVFEASSDDVGVAGSSDHTPEGRYDVVSVTPEFFRETTYLRLGERLVKIDIPDDAEMRGFFRDQMLVTLRSDWNAGGITYPQGALLAIDLDDFLEGSRQFEVLFAPGERVTLDEISATRHAVLYTTLDNVHSRLYRLTLNDESWTSQEVKLPGLGTVNLVSSSDEDDTFFFTYTDFVTPSSLYLVREGGQPGKVKQTPTWFDATGMKVVQYEAASKDGTRIPYFVFTPKGFEADGTNPTLLTAYGGFEVSQLPRYSGSVGTAWVARGGVYVLANIRGGGEFGPKWHQAAVKEKHQTNFDDFIAVAEDLIARKITSPEHLGTEGGSQGGLLVGGAFVQRPDLFRAVVCAVPLLDMKRYNKLLAGASWMGEYGNPDTSDWEYMKLWSPYQNLDPEQEYPRVFFWTNTRDDRVHPGHARKMVAKMTDMGKPVLYYENTEGGHASGANLNQRAYTDALSWAYLWMMLR